MAQIRQGRESKGGLGEGFTRGMVAPSFSGAGPAAFLKQTRAELKKVIWPSKKELLKLTLIVIGVSAAVGFFIGGIDYLLTKLLTAVVR